MDGRQGRIHSVLATWPAQLLVCLLVAVLSRARLFGDPIYHIDENFYLLVGHQLHNGAQLYADIWDRKPPGLFAIYYLAASFKNAVLAYQLLAMACAALTALLIARMAMRMASPRGALLAATLYLAMTTQFGGAGGQSPMFYNLPMAAAALLTGFSRTADVRRLMLAMLLAGAAITIKQVALFEAAFLGLFALYRLHSAGAGKARLAGFALLFAAIGALPTLLAMAWFAGNGTFADYWQATVMSVFLKQGQIFDPRTSFRMGAMGLLLLLPLAMTLFALRDGWRDPEVRPFCHFVALWLVAALLGVISVPNFYGHYVLPMLVVLAVGSARYLDKELLGLACWLALVGGAVYEFKPWDMQARDQHIRQYEKLASLVRQSGPRSSLLVYKGPVLLYETTGVAAPSPLVFAPHLYDANERNVSRLDTQAEVTRILASRPAVVVAGRAERIINPNRVTLAAVTSYVAQHCTEAGSAALDDTDWGGEIVVYDRCRD